LQILSIFLTPPLADRFLSYGPRDFSARPSSKSKKNDDKVRPRSNPIAQRLPSSLRSLLAKLCSTIFNPLSPLLDVLAKIRVPHSWFIHFYVVSVTSTLFWGYQIYVGGSAYIWILDHVSQSVTESKPKLFEDNEETGSGNGIEGLLVCWVLLLVQGIRRFWECLVFVKKDRSDKKSTMWIGHWFLGLLFYSTVNIAFWVERTGAFL
jgi:hypothetical protein